MSDDTLTQIEETLAHTLKMVDELNEIVTAQRDQIDRLDVQVKFLMTRERDREQEALFSDTVPIDKPPHY